MPTQTTIGKTTLRLVVGDIAEQDTDAVVTAAHWRLSMPVNALKTGEWIKVAEIPSQVLADRERFPETFDQFGKAVGHAYHIRDIDEHGHIELWLSDDGSEDSTGAAHSIWVEPEFVVAV